MGGSQKCTQGTPLVKARNSKKLKMLNLKFAWISDPAANTMQTAVFGQYHLCMLDCILHYRKMNIEYLPCTIFILYLLDTG